MDKHFSRKTIIYKETAFLQDIILLSVAFLMICLLLSDYCIVRITMEVTYICQELQRKK